jgi:hypothetical protein
VASEYTINISVIDVRIIPNGHYLYCTLRLHEKRGISLPAARHQLVKKVCMHLTGIQ